VLRGNQAPLRAEHHALVLTQRPRASSWAEPGDFDRFQPGEVLVGRTTAPAWTPLFARAAAVVTDGGTLAVHASLVAREYGIPAVVATGDATTRLDDGQVVTLDGGAGTVHSDR
jgi:pyruvate,water dikinase